MNDTPAPPSPDPAAPGNGEMRTKARRAPVYAPPAQAATVRRSRISPVWIIPLIALAIAAWLGYRTVKEEGPVIELTFRTADGLTAGQTQVRHKAVQLGQVENIRLSDDLQRVVVRVRMQRAALPYLNEGTRFWVVRPRISSGSLAGIETLVSGGYIEMDPAASRDGDQKLQYTGLEQPPGVRNGEPGRTYTLQALRVGSLTAGAPVFWRDITVGEVLGTDIGDGSGPVKVSIFVRAPYDGFVRDKSHFWNASGLSVQVGATGLHVEVASLQALLSGGVAFDTPQRGDPSPAAPADTEFKLYSNYNEAQAAGFTTTQAFVTYFENSVRGLGKGASVEFYGIQVGTVSDVTLEVDDATGNARVRVGLEIQPERVLGAGNAAKEDPVTTARRLVRRGMRAQLQTANYLTGQQVLSLSFAPNAPPMELQQVGNDLVIPSQGGGLDNILQAVSDMAGKLDRLPLEQIGQNLNDTLRSASGAMTSVDGLVKRADSGLSPLFKSLPGITAALQDAVAKAGRTFGSLDSSYGNNSQFQRELARAMTQVGDTARSIRILADFLDRHPGGVGTWARPAPQTDEGRTDESAHLASLHMVPAGLALSGCASPEPAYFTLAPVPGTPRQGGPKLVEMQRPWPRRLPGPARHRPRQQRRPTERRCTNERWGEPLGDLIGRILAEDLNQRLPGSSVFHHSRQHQCRSRMRGSSWTCSASTPMPRANVVLLAQVAVSRGRRANAATRTVRLTQRPAGPATRDLVATMSTVLGGLADTLAGMLRGMPASPSPSGRGPG